MDHRSHQARGQAKHRNGKGGKKKSKNQSNCKLWIICAACVFCMLIFWSMAMFAFLYSFDARTAATSSQPLQSGNAETKSNSVLERTGRERPKVAPSTIRTVEPSAEELSSKLIRGAPSSTTVAMKREGLGAEAEENENIISAKPEVSSTTNIAPDVPTAMPAAGPTLTPSSTVDATNSAPSENTDEGGGVHMMRSEDIDNDIMMPTLSVSNRVHGFYYAWYGNPRVDGKYLHWNHELLPHWNPQVNSKYPPGRHNPSIGDIGANFWPSLGTYSSMDSEVIGRHMRWMRRAGIGVAVLSWWGVSGADGQGVPLSVKSTTMILNEAARYEIKVAFHLEPYQGRTVATVRNDLVHIRQNYMNHPAMYKDDRDMPIFYVYDSYLIAPEEWAKLFKPNGSMTVRGTSLDAVYIGLLVEEKHKAVILNGGFDGFYTYFASNMFTFGSRERNWPGLAAFAKQNRLVYIPSAGPGYIDTRVRPWNGSNTVIRRNGDYYKQMLSAAIALRTQYISITSFNEWHEGTQIEPAVPYTSQNGFEYIEYDSLKDGTKGEDPFYYLDLTRELVSKLQ